MGEFRMPTLGADMTEGRIVAWHVAAGDEVHRGDIVATVDTSKAEALPGVKAVWVADSRTVRFAGQDVAAVAAVSPDVTEDAARLVKVAYKERPFAHELRAAMKEGAPVVYEMDKTPAGRDIPLRGNVAGPTGGGRGGSRGDVEKGFAEAEAVHEGTYYCPVHTHSQLETHGVIASWEGDQPTIYASTHHMDGSVMVMLADWAQYTVTLQPVKAAASIAPVSLVYKLHVFLGLTLFVLFPFTRLVHIVSAPVWYLGRRYQIVRQKG